jgi:EmrB/QacA subfamily drug resistance transporter
MEGEGSRRTRALAVLCLGALMIIIDGSIVNVALAPIRVDLGFSETGLIWVVNSYLLTFAGCMLLAGRLGDLFGYRRLFLIGIGLFTLASLGCGLAESRWTLIGARAVQGVGGAIVYVLALSFILDLFVEAQERARAVSIFGFVGAAGGSIAMLLGGSLASALNWHWIFLVNVPIGVTVYALGLESLPKDKPRSVTTHLDFGGALAMTASLMVALYAIVNRNSLDRTVVQTLGLLATAVALMTVFVAIEARASTPLVPLEVFRRHTLVVSTIIEAIATAATYTWGFIAALYLQLVLGYSPLQAGLAFLPSSQVTAAFALGLSARVVRRFGIKLPLTLGLLLMAAGFALFARAPVDGGFFADVLPGMLLVGLGLGMAPTPLTLAAMTDVPPDESGLASGIVNTASITGGALGLAILVTVAGGRRDALSFSRDTTATLNAAYHFAFLMSAVLTGVAAGVGVAFLKSKEKN